MEYRADIINASIAKRANTVKACQSAARLYSKIELPEAVYLRVNTRIKLANFLQAFGRDVKAIMHEYSLAVPLDTKLKSRARKQVKSAQYDEEITDFLF